MSSFTVDDGLEFKCPFCGAHCTVSAAQSCVLHTIPMCAQFNEMEPHEFMRAVNDELERIRLSLS